MKYADLHVHTYYSDGTDSPFQVVRMGKMRGLDMIAIADHDNFAGYFRAVKEAKELNIGLIPAVEITTIESHILGLNFNPSDSRFRKFVWDSQKIQESVSFQRVEILRTKGVPISFEKIKNAFPYSSIGKYSILWTMLLDDACRDYLKRNNYPDSFTELFKIFLGTHGIAGKVEKKRVIYWREAAEEIKKAGGLVIFPHPSKSARSPRDVLNLIEAVDGIEIQPRYANENKLFEDYARQNTLFITYGSDYHSAYGGARILGKENNQISDNFAKLLLKRH